MNKDQVLLSRDTIDDNFEKLVKQSNLVSINGGKKSRNFRAWTNSQDYLRFLRKIRTSSNPFILILKTLVVYMKPKQTCTKNDFLLAPIKELKH